VIETDQVSRGDGIQLESLIPSAAGHLLSGYINHIEVGGCSQEDLEHEGEEFGFVLEGQVELTVAGRHYQLGAGDSFHFRSERPHAYRNTGTAVARILWINTPPTF
jgi:uncharacterized cupin superfamily protein